MQVIRTLDEVKNTHSPLFITIGFFDGFHSGHRFLLKKFTTLAKKKDAKTLLISFDEIKEPQKEYGKGKSTKVAKKHIYPIDSKIKILNFFGVDYSLFLSFDKIRNTPYRDFLDFLLKNCSVKGIIASDKLSFGYQKKGTPKRIEEYFKAKNCFSYFFPSLKTTQKTIKFGQNKQKVDVSSSIIRQLLVQGKIYQANRKLLLPFHISGIVEKGNAWGRKIDFPTINLAYPEDVVAIPSASYITLTEIDQQIYFSMSYVGIPMKKNISVIETYLLDFANSVYNKRVKVYFLTFLESNQNINSLGELELLLLRLKRKAEIYFAERSTFLQKKLNLIGKILNS